MSMSSKKIYYIAVSLLIGVLFFFTTPPEGLTAQSWHLLGIFVATIFALITQPLPMGAVSIIAITTVAFTKTLSINDALSGFANTTIWLIVMAFFISRGIIKTGLGERLAYFFIKTFGKKTLGLSYALISADLCLSPAMPSNTARAGGVIYPIISALSNAFGSRTTDGSEKKIGSYLHTVIFQGDMITSAMFLTAMAANPMAAEIAKKTLNIDITWTGWFLATSVPGLISLIIIPFLIYKLNPPDIKETPEAPVMASEHLKAMGPVKKEEKIMIGVFALLLVLWILGGDIAKMLGGVVKIDATITAFIGLSILILSNVLTWEDIKAEKNAWDTLVWFSALVMMANFLNSGIVKSIEGAADAGMKDLIPWFSDLVASRLEGVEWVVALVSLAIVYFYSHYFFASATAHVTAMYAAFIAVAVALGAPPMLSALILAIFSNLFGCLTNYGSGPAPIYYGAGYVTQAKWFGIGFIVSVVNIVIWGSVGAIWWKILGLW